MANRRPRQKNIMFNNSVLMGGTYTMHTNQEPLRDPLKILQEASSPSAFHNSGERYDPPKCHKNTRVAVLKKIMDWIIGCDQNTRNKWIMWLYGGAGAGKSAIGQTIAERCEAEGRLLGSFFFGRSDGTRNHAKFLIPTITCQIYANVPGVRDDIASIINNDPLIFNRTLLIQLRSLVIEPLTRLGDTVSRNLIIIDGLDECLNRASQVTILCALFDVIQKHGCRIRFLVASRPEHDIVNAFSVENVDMILARLVLDDEYQSYKDIKLFLFEKFKNIAETHPFGNRIPEEWPGNDVVKEIAEKSSGQFIYASTVVKYVESIHHRPDHRLDIVRNLRARKGDSDLPFADLDALYTHILSSIENPSLVLEILSFIVHETRYDGIGTSVEAIELIHDLEPGTIQVLLCDIGALIAVEYSKGVNTMKVLHASLLDFLIDPSRSKDLYVSGNLLIEKHMTNCLRFLSSAYLLNPIGEFGPRAYEHFFKGNIYQETTTSVVVRFLANYCARVSFTEDMASAFDGFSPLKLFQHDTLHLLIKHNFLREANPALLELIHRSDQYRFLSRYLTMLDESYLTLLDNYSPGFLALQISILMHEDVFPALATTTNFQLLPFCTQDDILGILVPEFLYIFVNSPGYGFRGTSERHRTAFREFLLDPVRSRHHNFQISAWKIYAKSLLECFNYLNTLLFRYSCSKDGIWLIPFNKRETAQNLKAVFDNEGYWDASGDKCHIPDVHRITKGDMDQYFPYSPGKADFAEAQKRDIRAWYQNWHQVVGEDVNWGPGFGMSSSTDYLDVRASMRRFLRGRYGLMLGYMIYFFPRAGKCQNLIELCKTTVLRRDVTLFPADTISAQRAMVAYVKRVEELEDDE